MEDDRGRILLHQRTDFNGCWSLPGGSSEFGESIQATIEREVEEETGLRLEVSQPIGFSSQPDVESFRYPNGDHVHLFAMIFWSKKWSGTLRSDPGESPLLRFFPIDSIPDMRPNEQRSLDHFRQFRQDHIFRII